MELAALKAIGIKSLSFVSKIKSIVQVQVSTKVLKAIGEIIKNYEIIVYFFLYKSVSVLLLDNILSH